MKTLSTPVQPLITLATIFALSTITADAQTRTRPGAYGARPAASPAEPVAKIEKLTALGRDTLVRTPEFDYNTNILKTSNRPREWVRILVEYQTYPEWTDELVFQYYVMTVAKVDGQNHYSLFRNNIRYIDIPGGRRNEHRSVVFLHPTTIERYGMPVAVAVEILYQGQVIAQESDVDSGSKVPPEEWWKNPAVTDSKLVTRRDGYLLNRNETPFALINVEDYEVIR